MSSLITSVYCRRSLTSELLGSIDEFLGSACQILVRTRRGRVWECHFGNLVVNVRVEETIRVLWDCEEDLLRMGLLPEDAPCCITLDAPCRTPEIRQVVRSLAEGLSQLAQGMIVVPGEEGDA